MGAVNREIVRTTASIVLVHCSGGAEAPGKVKGGQTEFYLEKMGKLKTKGSF